MHITSTSGLIGNFGQANYAAAKLGITALSKSIALDMERYNVRSNCIAPFAWSRMTQSIPASTPEQQARVAKIQPMTPDKNAPMAVFLSSDAAKDVTGQVFGTRMNEIILFSSPRPIRIVHRADGWTPETIAEHAAAALKAASCRSIVPAKCSAGIRSKPANRPNRPNRPQSSWPSLGRPSTPSRRTHMRPPHRVIARSAATKQTRCCSPPTTVRYASRSPASRSSGSTVSMKYGSSFLKLTNDTVVPAKPTSLIRTISSAILRGVPISG